MTRYPHEELLEQVAETFLSEVPLAGFNTEKRQARLTKTILEAIERQIDSETESYEPPSPIGDRLEPRLYDALRDGRVDYEPDGN